MAKTEIALKATILQSKDTMLRLKAVVLNLNLIALRLKLIVLLLKLLVLILEFNILVRRSSNFCAFERNGGIPLAVGNRVVQTLLIFVHCILQ